jgi:hypothetical protein
MKFKNLFLLLLIISVFSSCGVLNQKIGLELPNATYKSKDNLMVYIENSNDTIKLYSKNSNQTDFTQNKPNLFVNEVSKEHINSSQLHKNSIDFDFLTIPFKYRPKQKDLPNQFTTNLNGAFYFGRRTDYYKINYIKTPLNKFSRDIKHYAFSFGVFSGLGATSMNPSVTQDKISKEYEGLVWSKGLAGIIGINSFTLGIALGFDSLLDENRKDWIYEQKMWYGLAFGLNLN